MRLSKFIALLCLSVSLAVGAAEPPYLTPQQLDLTRFLPTPAGNGSPELQLQKQQVLAAQAAASPERIAQAVSDASGGAFHIFAPQLGPQFSATKLPLTAKFLERLNVTDRTLMGAAKDRYDTKRPYLSHPDIKALVRISSGDSYPSGHTSHAMLSAIMLANMLPEKRAALHARASDYAYSRIVGGMHYPQDIEGGRLAGTAMAVALFANPAFVADYEAARTEVRQALLP